MNNGPSKHLHFLEMPPCWITSRNIWQFGQFGHLAPVQQRGVEGGLAAWFCQFFPTCLCGSLSFPSLLFSLIARPMHCAGLCGAVLWCLGGWAVGPGSCWPVPWLGFGSVYCPSASAVLWAVLSGCPYYVCGAGMCWLIYTRSCVDFWHWCRLSCMFLTLVLLASWSLLLVATNSGFWALLWCLHSVALGELNRGGDVLTAQLSTLPVVIYASILTFAWMFGFRVSSGCTFRGVVTMKTQPHKCAM